MWPRGVGSPDPPRRPGVAGSGGGGAEPAAGPLGPLWREQQLGFGCPGRPTAGGGPQGLGLSREMQRQQENFPQGPGSGTNLSVHHDNDRNSVPLDARPAQPPSGGCRSSKAKFMAAAKILRRKRSAGYGPPEEDLILMSSEPESDNGQSGEENPGGDQRPGYPMREARGGRAGSRKRPPLSRMGSLMRES